MMIADDTKRYGHFGGSYLPELLISPVKALEAFFGELKQDENFNQAFLDTLENYAGRPTPLTEVANFRKLTGGPCVFLKREDLLHTGAHKINNTLGQCLIAKKMGKRKIIAETGAGQHGVATATACARLGLSCTVYMGKLDTIRQAPNVKKMELLGATVIAVDQGSGTLKEAVNEAMRAWASTFEDTHYCLGSALGPHPYPQIVAYFQSVIGREVKKQCMQRVGKYPDTLIACVGGGSNAIGLFEDFLEDDVKLIGVEAGGCGDKLGEHAARFKSKKTGVLHGCFSYVLQDKNGQIANTHSISAGLDYPMIGPQHAFLHDTKRATYDAVTDEEALHAMKLLARSEGIIPALESSHALAYYVREAKNMPPNTTVVINLSGAGNKDLPQLFSDGRL